LSVESNRAVFLSGLSGSGKSTAMAALEDLGFYCVDNLPPQLVAQFVDLCSKATPPIRKIALTVDAREEAFLSAVPSVVEQLRRSGLEVEVIFLDCADDVLVSRYRETRRVHPLSPGGSVQEGIALERRLLTDVARLADFRLDTTRLNVHQLKDTVAQHVSGLVRATVVSLISFGFRFGTPPSAELLFDVRFLPNPHFEPALRTRTGEDPEVAKYVLENPRAVELVTHLRELLAFLLPLYDREGKSYLTIGIGCTGGRHRSVAIASLLAQVLRAEGREANVSHRDVGKTS
jgi:UPF0042 nucleotide-binding protein